MVHAYCDSSTVHSCQHNPEAKQYCPTPDQLHQNKGRCCDLVQNEHLRWLSLHKLSAPKGEIGGGGGGGALLLADNFCNQPSFTCTHHIRLNFFSRLQLFNSVSNPFSLMVWAWFGGGGIPISLSEVSLWHNKEIHSSAESDNSRPTEVR
jgi:hypothetical protein